MTGSLKRNIAWVQPAKWLVLWDIMINRSFACPKSGHVVYLADFKIAHHAHVFMFQIMAVVKKETAEIAKTA